MYNEISDEIMTEELNKRDIITMNLIKLCQKKYQ